MRPELGVGGDPQHRQSLCQSLVRDRVHLAPCNLQTNDRSQTCPKIRVENHKVSEEQTAGNTSQDRCGCFDLSLNGAPQVTGLREAGWAGKGNCAHRCIQAPQSNICFLF